jgi:hypothetical protein
MEILEPAFLGAFLNHLERDRGLCARSRNVRLAAIHSFFRCFRQLDLAPFDLLFWPHPLVNHHSAPGRSEALRRP